MENDHVFGSGVAQAYEAHLVPMLFEPYAADMVRRLSGRGLTRVIELAAGTGVVTRALAAALPDSRLIATDLNSGMIDVGRGLAPRRIDWVQADAQHLPFGDSSCDAVVCQFGWMFFPERSAAFAEARRVLRPGGLLAFSVWDRLEANEFANVVTTTLASLFPDDPPAFLRRTPHGYHDGDTIAHDLARAGFTEAGRFELVTAISSAESPLAAAAALCVGSPLRREIEARDPGRLDEATRAAAEAIGRRFGTGRVEGAMRALVVLVSNEPGSPL